MNVFITGASGFVGRRLCEYLTAKGLKVTAGLRRSTPVTAGVSSCVYQDLEDPNKLAAQLAGHDAVVHLAALVHQLQPIAAEQYIAQNVELTKNFLSAAKRAGVKHFVFMSTIKVHGERTTSTAITEASPLAAEDPYGKSKIAAEAAVQAAATDDFSYCILRPPLIYGPGVKANFARLSNLVAKSLPLPLAKIDNKRSMLFLDHLCELIYLALCSAAAKNQIFVLADPKPQATPALLTALATAHQVPLRLLPIPVRWLKLIAKLTGKTELLQRLTDSLEVDCGKVQRLLAWSPTYDFDAAIKLTVKS